MPQCSRDIVEWVKVNYPDVQDQILEAIDKNFSAAGMTTVIDSAIQDQIINSDKTKDVRDTVARGRDHYGMQTIDQHLTDLYKAGIITLEVALDAASNPSDFQRALTFE